MYQASPSIGDTSKPKIGFKELLSRAYPYASPSMHDNRPAVITCYFHRDHEYAAQAEKLARGIVLSLPEDYEGELSLDDVAKYIAASGWSRPPLYRSGGFERGAISHCYQQKPIGTK
jgi:hypothetical protein